MAQTVLFALKSMSFPKVKQSVIWMAFGTIVMVVALWFRLSQLTEVPPSPYWEEVALGYDAYSLLQTGKDHHGNPWPGVALESFGDWKPSGYFYLLLPFINTFGLSVWSVRLPAVIAGTLLVLGIGFSTHIWWRLATTGKRKTTSIPPWLLALTLAAFSPWAITFSRAAWEVMVATTLLTWGVVAFLTALLHLKQTTVLTKKGVIWLALAVALLILSTYVYHSLRVIAPLMGLMLFGLWWGEVYALMRNRRQVAQASVFLWIVLGVLALVSLLPQLKLLNSPAISRRLAETSIFSLNQPILESNALREREGNTLLSRVIHHRYVLYGRLGLAQFLDHFRLDYLFVKGDNNPRHSVQYFGLFYPLDALLFFAGILSLSVFRKRYLWFLALWIVISIIPSAISQAAPHALRTLPALPAAVMLLAIGVNALTFSFSRSSLYKLGIGVIGLVYLAQVVVFWRYYTRVYRVQYAHEWQYGYQQMVAAVKKQENAHPEYHLYISRELGRPAMYYWFFSQKDPREVQAVDAFSKQVEGEFIEYERVTFPLTHSELAGAPAIYAASEAETTLLEERVAGADREAREVVRQETIFGLDGRPIWVISLLLPESML